MVERFRRGWWGWIRSSQGYSVRLLGRTKLQYRDRIGDLTISAEAMSKPWSNVVVYTSSIPSRADRSTDQVIGRLQRAFKFAGWTMIEEPGDEDSDGA